MWGGRFTTPPHPRATAAPAAFPAPQHGSSISSPPHCSCHAEPRRSAAWPMINTTGCGAKSYPSGGAVIPIRGACLPALPGTWRPTVQWGCQGGGTKQQSWGRGQGRGFHGAATTAIVLGRIRQRHRQPDSGSHGPGPAPVRGMAWQPAAPHGHDKGSCCWPAAAGPSLRSWPGGASR
jgi:hypothetical protein